MKILPSLAAGSVGALALTALHETVRRLRPCDAPRLDLLGERGLRKLLAKAGAAQPDESKAYVLTMTGDVVSNALYYSLVGSGRHSLRRGLLLGVAAGMGGVAARPAGPGQGPQQPHAPNPGHDRGLVHGGRRGGRGGGRRAAQTPPVGPRRCQPFKGQKVSLAGAKDQLPVAEPGK